MEKVPVFIVNGFLESGKTTFIKEFIENDEQIRQGNIVIIATESGEVDYSHEWQERYGVHVVEIDEEEEFTPDRLESIDKELCGDFYIIELNSFFDNVNIMIPPYMQFIQQMTMIDASTFKVMFNNMKNVFSNVLKYSDIVIFNRCKGNEDLATFRRQVRVINQRAQIAFETPDGSLTTKLEEDLPYDLKQDRIYIEDDIYPIWYADLYDHYEKYFNKIFRFNAFVSGVVDRKTFIVGRNVMVCCAEDIQTLGYEVVNDTKVKIHDGDNIYLECEVKFEYSKIDKENSVVLHAKRIEKMANDLTKVIGMN